MADIKQWDIEIKELPLTGDKVTVCGVDFIFGNWEPDENYTTSYNVQIGRTVGECARNLGAAINCIDGRFGGWHLSRYISPVYALQFGKIIHLRMRDLKSSGSNVIVESDAGDRIVITEYEGNVPEGGGGGGESVLIKKTIATNGTYNAAVDSADGYSEVTVNVLPNVISKSISANGEYIASSDSADGYSSVSVSVPEKSIGTDKIVSTNGEYIASSDNVDGYSSLIVKVDNPLLTPYYTDYNAGYINVNSSVPSKNGFLVEHPSNCYCDIYFLTAGRSYLIYIDNQSRSRFRVMTARVHPAAGVSGDITSAVEAYGVLHVWDGASGGGSIYRNTYTILEMEYTGFLIIQKTNTGQTGLKSYVIDKDFFVNPPVSNGAVLAIPHPLTISAGTTIGPGYGSPLSIPVSVTLKQEDGTEIEVTTEPCPFDNPTGIDVLDGGFLSALAFEDASCTVPLITMPIAGTYYIKLQCNGNWDEYRRLHLRGGTLIVE